MNTAINHRMRCGIFQQNTIVDSSYTFLASEFIALIADRLQLQLKGENAAQY